MNNEASETKPILVPETVVGGAEGVPFYIVIAAHGDAARLGRTLRSLAASRLPPGYRALLLVENGARAGIEAAAAAAPADLRIRYLYHPPPSKSLALNLALAQIEEPGAFIFFTDDDAGFAANVLETYAIAAAAHGKGHYFGGPVDARWEEIPPDWLLPSLPTSAKGWELSQDEALYAFLGINWGAFLSDIRNIGQFDSRFGPGSIYGGTGQETDMQIRLFRAGLVPIYLPNAKVSHEVLREKCNYLWTLHRNYRAGISAAISDMPFQPIQCGERQIASGMNLGKKTFVQKAWRLILRSKSLADFLCRVTCQLAVYVGMIKGFVIKKRPRR